MVVLSDQQLNQKKPPKHERSVEVTLLQPAPNRPLTMVGNGTQSGGANSVCTGKDENYKGIGIIVNPALDSGLIIEAPPFYPAYKAGMRVGDRIYDPYKAPDAGGVYHYLIQRPDFSRVVIHVRKEKICFRK
jgi:hypothetical protein